MPTSSTTAPQTAAPAKTVASSTTTTTTATAGGGSATASRSEPSDLSAKVLQTELQKIYKELQVHSLRETQCDPSALNGEYSFDEFVSYLAAPQNSLVALPDLQNKDWSRPLNEYFISSSHNTYLVGHQLYGSSTTAGYMNVLRRGCRCIEIDVWDGDDGEPEVFHGYTLTKEISFRDVCKAIAKHAFDDGNGNGEVGEAPVIISLECHAGHKQQYKMVDIMKETWGDMLIQGIEPEDVTALPCPQQLKRKILVKTKYIPKPPAADLAQNGVKAAQPLQKVASGASTSSSSSSSSDSELEELSRSANKTKPKKSKVVRALAALGIYASAHHFPSKLPQPFTAAETSRIPNHVYSLSEKVFHSQAEERAREIFEHNKHYLMRVYPFGLRFSSSNADPTPFWATGVQLVALNWQKCDEAMMLNEGMFAGEQGFVLKPQGYKPGDAATTPAQNTLDLTLEIIAAANIPLPDEDTKAKGFEPYVKVELMHTTAGWQADEMVKSRKERTKSKRGCDVTWNQTLEFRGVGPLVEKLTFLRIRVLDDEIGHDDLAAWACVRLDRLQAGYRVVRLFDSRGQESKGVILVKVGKLMY